MKEVIHLNIDDTQRIQTIAKALSSESRLEILKVLEGQILNVSEIAAKLQIPMSSAALHIKTLEEAGLVITQPLPGIRGSQKRSGVKVSQLTIDLSSSYEKEIPYRTAYYSIPIGNYFDFQVTAPCGIASETRFLSATDAATVFYVPDHSTAQLIWFTHGYLEYRFSNASLCAAKEVESIEFSFEACSEAQGYNNEWPSDITLWINRQEVGTFTSDGDFGGTRGMQNPVWWPDTLTQYGQIHRLCLTREGCFIDGRKTSDLTLDSLHVCDGDCLLFRIGIKPDARYVGGLNLFGEHFGNSSQHINVKVNYIPNSK